MLLQPASAHPTPEVPQRISVLLPAGLNKPNPVFYRLDQKPLLQLFFLFWALLKGALKTTSTGHHPSLWASRQATFPNKPAFLLQLPDNRQPHDAIWAIHLTTVLLPLWWTLLQYVFRFFLLLGKIILILNGHVSSNLHKEFENVLPFHAELVQLL